MWVHVLEGETGQGACVPGLIESSQEPVMLKQNGNQEHQILPGWEYLQLKSRIQFQTSSPIQCLQLWTISAGD